VKTTKVFFRPYDTPGSKGYRYDVFLEDGTPIMIGSLNPGNDTARALVARGISGRMTTHDYGSYQTTARMIYPDIQTAASRCVLEGNLSGPVERKWKENPYAT